MNILGVRVDNLTLADATQKARDFLYDGNQHKIFTPNPEMLVKAQKDEYFKDVLNSGDLNLCDGFGISLFFKIKRLPGADFMLEICKIAEEMRESIYLLGTLEEDTLKKAAENLQKQLPSLKIVGFNRGPQITEVISYKLQVTNAQLSIFEDENKVLLESINTAKPTILFVGFGMGKQEKWIYENLAKMPSVKIAMGVGGAFDFLSGKIRRAPCWMRKIGLEWVYRLVQEPKRIGRIFNATARFIFLVLKDKI